MDMSEGCQRTLNRTSLTDSSASLDRISATKEFTTVMATNSWVIMRAGIIRIAGNRLTFACRESHLERLFQLLHWSGTWNLTIIWIGIMMNRYYGVHDAWKAIWYISWKSLQFEDCDSLYEPFSRLCIYYLYDWAVYLTFWCPFCLIIVKNQSGREPARAQIRHICLNSGLHH